MCFSLAILGRSRADTDTDGTLAVVPATLQTGNSSNRSAPNTPNGANGFRNRDGRVAMDTVGGDPTPDQGAWCSWERAVVRRSLTMSANGQPITLPRETMTALSDASAQQTGRPTFDPPAVQLRAGQGAVELIQQKDEEIVFLQTALMKQVC